MRGHVIVAEREGRLAVWQTSPEGIRSGAWVTDADLDQGRARTVLSLVERRAVAGVDRDADLAVLDRLAGAAGVAMPAAYGEQWVDLCEVHLEVAEVRAQMADALRTRSRQSDGLRTRSRQAGAQGDDSTGEPTGRSGEPTGRSTAAPLTYAYPVEPRPWPRDLNAALDRARLSLPASPAEPAAQDAMAKALLVQAAVVRWADTESVRLRREPLRSMPGPTARPLPPRWQARLTAVYEAVLDLRGP